jgi:hypothetical protein
MMIRTRKIILPKLADFRFKVQGSKVTTDRKCKQY